MKENVNTMKLTGYMYAYVYLGLLPAYITGSQYVCHVSQEMSLFLDIGTMQTPH